MFIKGAKKGQQQPRTPIIAKDTASSVAYAKILYGLSEGEIAGLADGGKSIFLNDTPIINDNGLPNFTDSAGNGIDYQFRAGTNEQEHITGFGGVENETAVNVIVKANRPFVKSFNNRQLSAVRVRLSWSALRTQNATNGDVTGALVLYAIDVQTDDGAFVTVLDTRVMDKTSAGYERAHRIDLPKGSRWTIRVRRISPDSTSDLVSDEMAVSAVTEIIDAKLRYPNTAMLALRYDAKTFSNIAKLAVRLKGKIINVPSNYNADTREYKGLWDGTFKQAYSNNPAWVFYDICTQWRYGLGDRLDKAMIDKWSLYALGQYCDELVDDGKGGKEPRFSVNVYLQSSVDAFSVLQSLSSLFRAMSFWQGEQIVLDADMPKDPVFTFSGANVVDGVFNYTGTRAKDRHTVAKVAWDNPDNRFKTEYEFVKDEQAIAKLGIKMLELNMMGCTSQGQAQRAGLWALLSEQLQTRTVTFKTGLDGFIPQVGQVINIADNLLAGQAISGRILAIDGDRAVLDRATAKVGDTLLVNGDNGKIVKQTITAVSRSVADNLLDSTAPITSQEYLLASIPITKPLTQGTPVKLVIHANLGEDRSKLALYNSSPNRRSLLTELDKNNSGIYEAEFNWRVGNGDNNVLHIYQAPRTARQASDLTLAELTLSMPPTGDIVRTRGGFYGVSVDNVWAVHSSDLVTMPFRVMSVNQDSDTTFTITALQYNEQKFNATDFGARLTKTPISVIEPSVLPAPSFVNVASNEKVEQGLLITSLVIAWEQVKGAVSYDVVWQKDNDGWQQLPRQSGNSVQIDGVYRGTYIAKVTPINAFGQAGATATSEPTTILGKQGKPPALSFLKVKGVLFGMSLTWGFGAGSGDTNYTEIEVSPNRGGDIAVLGQFAYPTDKHEITGLQGNLTQYYRGRIVDKLGNKSDWTAWVQGTTDASADKVLDLLNGQLTKSQLHQSLATPIGNINNLQTAVMGVNGELSTVNQRLSAVQHDLSAATAHLASERNRISAAIRDINALQTADNAQAQVIVQLSQTVGNHSASIRELGISTGDLAQKYSQIQTQTDTASSAINAIKQTQSSQATSVENLSSRFDGVLSSPNLLDANTTAKTSTAFLLGAYPITGTLLEGQAVIITATATPMQRVLVYNSSPRGENRIGEIVADGSPQKLNWVVGNAGNRRLHIYRTSPQDRSSVALSKVGLRLVDGALPSLGARLDELKQTQANGDEQLASRITALDSAYQQADNHLSSRLSTAQSATSNALGTITSEVRKLNASLGGKADAVALSRVQTKISQIDGRIDSEVQMVNLLQSTINRQTASIQSLYRVVNGNRAEYTLKVDVGGRVAGFGLASDGSVSDFAVRADKFYIAPPSGNGKGDSPFMVLTAPQRVDGTLVPAGTYLKSAHIHNASIDTLHIKGEAVVVPRALRFDDSRSGYEGEAFVATIQSENAPVVLQCHFSASVSDYQSKQNGGRDRDPITVVASASVRLVIEVYCNGAFIHLESFLLSDKDEVTSSARQVSASAYDERAIGIYNYLHINPPSTATYSIKIRRASNSYGRHTIHNGSLLLMAVKR